MGCLPKLSADQLLADVRSAPVMVLEQYEDRHVEISGTFVRAGVENVEELNVRLQSMPDGIARVERGGMRARPYAELRGSSPELGHIVCYILDDARPYVAAIEPGTQVALGGVLRTIIEEDTVVVLEDCHIGGRR